MGIRARNSRQFQERPVLEPKKLKKRRCQDTRMRKLLPEGNRDEDDRNVEVLLD